MLAGICANVTLWLLCGIMDMTIAAFGKDPRGRTSARIFYEMFDCWRNAFADFVPGAFSNKVMIE